MSRLSALAAAMATAQTGCSGEQPVASGATQPVVDIPGTSGTAVAIQNPTSVPTATQPPTPATNVPVLPSTGYAVVDPMPPPAVCQGVSSSIQATATWKARKGGGFSIEVKLGKPGRADASYKAGATLGTAYAAKLTSQQIAADSAALTLEPDAGKSNSYYSLQVPVNCNKGPAHVSVELDASKPPAANAAVPVTLYDSW